ncbi:hypothetical protein IFM5058_10623, partial [Aspergillus udagawae]
SGRDAETVENSTKRIAGLFVTPAGVAILVTAPPPPALLPPPAPAASAASPPVMVVYNVYGGVVNSFCPPLLLCRMWKIPHGDCWPLCDSCGSRHLGDGPPWRPGSAGYAASRPADRLSSIHKSKAMTCGRRTPPNNHAAQPPAAGPQRWLITTPSTVMAMPSPYPPTQHLQAPSPRLPKKKKRRKNKAKKRGEGRAVRRR